MDLPAAVETGLVVGVFNRAVLDDIDAGTEPNQVASTGQLVFTPDLTGGRLLVPDSTPPQTVLVQPVPVALVAGALSVRLVADDGTWTWTVSGALDGKPVAPFSFHVPAGGTVDLTLVAPVATAAGGELYIAQAVAAAASAAISAAAAQAAADLVGAPADDAVAALLGNPASATRAVANSTYGRAPVVNPPPGFAFKHLAIPMIQRLGGGRFLTTLDLDAMRPPAGVTYYVAPQGIAGNSGLTSALPTLLGTAMGKADVGTIVFANGEYTLNYHVTTPTTKSINYLAAGPDVRVTGWQYPGGTAWTLEAGAIYKATIGGATQVYDRLTRTAWGDYTPYLKMANLAAIVAPGQWALVGSTVYVWALGSTNLTVSANRYQIRVGQTSTNGVSTSAGTSYFRGIDFEGCDAGGTYTVGTATVIAEDCTFKYSNGAGAPAVVGGHGFIAVRCESSSNVNDGFSYHAAGGAPWVDAPDFIEVDCKSHHNGVTLATDINNASTSHETCRGIRVGGDYRDCNGPVVADVNSAQSWNLGSIIGKSLSANALQRHSWRVDCVGYEAAPAVMWVDECTAEGADYAYKATGVGATINTHASRAKGLLGVYDPVTLTGLLKTYEPA